MISFRLSAYAGVVGLAFLPAFTSAQSITLTLDSVDPLAVYSGHAGGLDFGPGVAGLENFILTGQEGVSYPASPSLFCIELQQNIALGSNTTFKVVSADQGSKGVATGLSANISLAGIGSARALYLEVLYAHVFPAVYNPSALNSSDRSAFQLAVWELSHDDDFNLTTVATSPHFWVTSPVDPAITQAQTWVSWVGSNYTTAATMALSALHSDTIQDFIIPAETSAFSPIPEPASVAAIAGLAAFFGVLWRKRRARAV